MPSPAPSFTRDPISGETSARIATGKGAAAELRSGTTVHIALPTGFTIYPGARIIENTVVERGRGRHVLLVAETGDPAARVTGFYREQARRARIALTLDLVTEQRASLGGALPGGGGLVIAVREEQGRTRIEIAAN